MDSYALPQTLDSDIDKLQGLIERFKKEEIPSAELKAHRVPFGIYEQRKLDTYMVRIRCPAGIVSPLQLKKVSELSQDYAQGKLHLTTRQELQIHYVALDNIIPIIRGLRDVGLASRGGGGNTVRNIVTQEDAGICWDEKFDVTPYAVALTSRLINETDSWTLPRKFKFSFSGSNDDRSYATIADVGFIAQIKNQKQGFKVYMAGGMGANSSLAVKFLEFIPDDQVYLIAKTAKNIFWKYGNRKNKHAARFRFLWKELGEKEFRNKFNQELENLKKDNPKPLSLDQIPNQANSVNLPKVMVEGEDFSLWLKRFCTPQKQEGLFSILIPVELGFLENDKAKALSEFLEPFGDNVIRLSKEQNFLLRNIKKEYLENFYLFLKEIFQPFNRALIYDKIITCAGASTCQLGICLSRGVTKEIKRKLFQSGCELDSLANIKINISGCPNACGQHHIADIGFFGKVVRYEGRMYPAYNIVTGGIIGDEITVFAKKIGEVSAKKLPQLIIDFIKLYQDKKEIYRSFKHYIGTSGREDIGKLCEKYKRAPTFEEDKSYYVDWGASSEFSLAGRGMGECSAGIFDLIDIDRENILKTKEDILEVASDIPRAVTLRKFVFFACRMLLITRGVEPKTELQVYENFKEFFINTGLVDSSYVKILDLAYQEDDITILDKEQKVNKLVEKVEFLYEIMDNSFNFGIEVKVESTQRELAHKPKVVKDFRGVACPMNFVKTKLELAKLVSKDLLEIYLDEGEPIDNVPGSLKAEGHRVVKQKKINDYWSVIIEKK